MGGRAWANGSTVLRSCSHGVGDTGRNSRERSWRKRTILLLGAANLSMEKELFAKTWREQSPERMS